MVSGDHLSAVNEILLRLNELNQRLSCLSFGDSVELMRGLKRLEDCRERMEALFALKEPLGETLWGLVGELKSGVGMGNVCREGGKLMSVGRREKGSESARFDDRVVQHGDSVRFSSARFGFNKLSLMVFDSVESST